jgi:two-component system, chemotaxis family, protein-glutamate methylesterase/glutaminase
MTVPPWGVVIGASAGGIEALKSVVSRLPGDLPAAVLVTLHISADSPSALARILDRVSPLPAYAADDGAELEAGRIYVAVPDRHLVIENGRIVLAAGPRENGHRPAIDPLFRSAAAEFGPRLVGVILSGSRDDGVAGLAAVKRVGGAAIVQDPDDALVRNMPRNAIAHVDVDDIRPADEIGAAVTAVVRESGQRGAAAMSVNDPAEPVPTTASPANATGLTCPDCGGALWEIEDGGIRRYRCHVGHLFSDESLSEVQADQLEHALWAAVRALEERAALMRRGVERLNGVGSTAEHFARLADTHDDAARQIRAIVTARPAVELPD